MNPFLNEEEVRGDYPFDCPRCDKTVYNDDQWDYDNDTCVKCVQATGE